MRFAALLAIVSTALMFAACGGDEEESYATLQECFDDHHNVESLPVDQAIATCCLEHELGGHPKNTLCGADAAGCNTYVTANLTSTSATAAEITAGCTSYASQH